MKRALVTGATGQDGSYAVERLLAEGWEVHALVRDRMAEGETGVGPEVEQHVGDLTAIDALDVLVRDVEPDLIMNLGGVTSVGRSWHEPALTGLVSGVSAVALMSSALSLQESRGREVRMIQPSSAEIFGSSSGAPQNESTPLAPVSPYGAAKAFAHHSAGIFRARGLPVSCAILYNHESPRRPSGFVTRKITRGAALIARGRESELVLGNLDARRDWGWAPDYVDAMMRMTRAAPGDFVIATGTVHSVREFVAAAFTAAGVAEWEKRVRVAPEFLRPDDAETQVGDPSRARTELSWMATTDFEQIVAAMVRADLESIDADDP